jgi:hypothetical protein
LVGRAPASVLSRSHITPHGHNSLDYSGKVWHLAQGGVAMSRQFVTKVQASEIGMRPVLPLGQPLNVGHVGTIDEDGRFQYLGTVAHVLEVPAAGSVLSAQESPIQVTVTSGNSVKTSLQATAETTGPLAQFGDLKGKATISFERRDGFFLALQGLTIRQLAQPQKLFGPILNAYRQGRWEKEWVFIHRIGVTRHLTVILASEAGTTVLLRASGKAGLGGAAEADLAAGFRFVRSTKGVTKIVCGRNNRAFYDAYRVRDRWFSKPRVIPAKGVDGLGGSKLRMMTGLEERMQGSARVGQPGPAEIRLPDTDDPSALFERA